MLQTIRFQDYIYKIQCNNIINNGIINSSKIGYQYCNGLGFGKYCTNNDCHDHDKCGGGSYGTKGENKGIAKSGNIYGNNTLNKIYFGQYSIHSKEAYFD